MARWAEVASAGAAVGVAVTAGAVRRIKLTVDLRFADYDHDHDIKLHAAPRTSRRVQRGCAQRGGANTL